MMLYNVSGISQSVSYCYLRKDFQELFLVTKNVIKNKSLISFDLFAVKISECWENL